VSGWVDLGHGVRVRPYVQGGVPGHAGLLERHDCTTGREHTGMLPFDRGQGDMQSPDKRFEQGSELNKDGS